MVESGLSDYDLKLFRGWSLDSKMPKRYLQLTNRGLNKRMLELAGIEKVEVQNKVSPLKPKLCYRCKQENTPDAKFCSKCNFVLSAEAFEEMREKEKEKDKQLETLQRFTSFQMHIFTEHSGRPSKKCELCRKAMDELSSMSLGQDGTVVASP